MKRSDIVTDIPKEILDNYEDVHLDIDIMFVNKRAYFTSISRHIGLIHCVPIASRENKRVTDAMQRIIDQYRSRGFKVTTVDGDNEFKEMDEWMTDKSITLNTCDTNEHIPTIERTNRFLKERIRCIRMEMPFSHVPRQFLKEVVSRVTILVNSIPRKGGVHAALSPREIVHGRKLQTPKYKIGQYVQGHIKSTNDTGKERSVDGLYLGPADNGCGHSIFKLQTKQPISVPRVTPIPITDDIIRRVNQLGKEEGEQEGIVCTDMFGNVTLDDLDYRDYDSDSEGSDDEYSFDDEVFEEEINAEENLDDQHGIGDDELQADYFVQHDSDSKPENEEVEEEGVMQVSDDKSTQESCITFEDKNDTTGNKRLQGTARMEYEILSNLGPYWEVDHESESNGANDVVMAMLTDYSELSASPNTPQYGFKKGIKLFEDDGYRATVSELKDNLVGRGCINMLKKEDITADVHRNATATCMSGLALFEANSSRATSR